MKDEELQARADIMKALASPVRLKIVEALHSGERCVCELQPLFTQSKSTLSRHIAQLRNVGIIAERREGVRSYLRLQTPCMLSIFDCVRNVIKADVARRNKIARAVAKQP